MKYLFLREKKKRKGKVSFFWSKRERGFGEGEENELTMPSRWKE